MGALQLVAALLAARRAAKGEGDTQDSQTTALRRILSAGGSEGAHTYGVISASEATPLMAASRMPSEVAGQLTAAGKSGDVEKAAAILSRYPESIHETDALYWACRRGQGGMVEFLVSKGADIHRTVYDDKSASMVASYDLKATAHSELNAAAKRGDAAAVRRLLERYPDLMVAQDRRRGDTVLFIACSSGHADVVELLVSLGADTQHRNAKGKTAADVARGAARSALDGGGASDGASEHIRARLAQHLASDSSVRVYGMESLFTYCCGWVTDGSGVQIGEVVSPPVLLTFGGAAVEMLAFGLATSAVYSRHYQAQCDFPLLDRLSTYATSCFANGGVAALMVGVMTASYTGYVGEQRSGVACLMVVLLALGWTVLLVVMAISFVGISQAWGAPPVSTSPGGAVSGCDASLVDAARQLIVASYAANALWIPWWLLVRRKLIKDFGLDGSAPRGPYMADDYLTEQGVALVFWALGRGGELNCVEDDEGKGRVEVAYTVPEDDLGRIPNQIRRRETHAAANGEPVTRTKFVRSYTFKQELMSAPCVEGGGTLAAAALPLIRSVEGEQARGGATV